MEDVGPPPERVARLPAPTRAAAGEASILREFTSAPYPIEGRDCLIIERYGLLETRVMRHVWTAIRGSYDTFYEVEDEGPTDFPFYRMKEDYPLCEGLRFLETADPPGEGEGPHLSWAHYPAVLLLWLGEMDLRYYNRASLAEQRFCDHQAFFRAAEQRELFVMPPRRINAIYPYRPKWWELLEMLRGMAVRLPQVAFLRGSHLLGEPRRGPYRSSFVTSWVAEVADVLVTNV